MKKSLVATTMLALCLCWGSPAIAQPSTVQAPVLPAPAPILRQPARQPGSQPGSQPVSQPVRQPDSSEPTQRTPATGTPGRFDNYVLVLSWSPDYCETNGDRDPQQCGSGKKLGFVLHGLWPQYVQGYPANCSSKPLLASVSAQFPGLYPSNRLYGHEWEKHGTCSGLTPQGYFKLSQTLKNTVAIPRAYQRPERPFRSTIAQLQQAFVQVNDEFQAEDVAPYCSGGGRFLQEVFFCYDKAGKPQACTLEVRRRSQRSCGQADFLVRNVR